MAVLLLCGCVDERPAAIMVDADPFLLNGPGPVALPARAVTAAGRTLPDLPLHATSNADTIATAEDGALKCLREGDAQLSLTVASLSAFLLVQCRPVSTTPFTEVELEAHGQPGPVPVVAYTTGGKRASALRFSAVSDDTAVAVVRDGVVVPRAIGRSRLRIDFGGLQALGRVTVVMPVREDTVAFAAGEYRTWPLPQGRFRISAHAADGRAAPTGVSLRPVGANCARDPHLLETIHCVVAETGQVVALAAHRRTIRLRIVRMPE